jgi:Holliday junction resolvase RusA-like endonuclease
MNFELPQVLDIVFLIPMPFTWSEKKKVKHNKTKVMKRPDLDNLVKAFMDALSVEDGYVWKITAEKRYSFNGSILVYA